MLFFTGDSTHVAHTSMAFNCSDRSIGGMYAIRRRLSIYFYIYLLVCYHVIVNSIIIFDLYKITVVSFIYIKLQ